MTTLERPAAGCQPASPGAARTALSLLGVGLALFLAGCTQASAQGPQAQIPPAPPAAPTAADAGGACQILDFAVIAETLGPKFDVAAATRQTNTHTCVLQAAGASRPDLVLTDSATAVDVALFRETVKPEGGVDVSGVARAAYRTSIDAGPGRGPGVEVGWLTADRRLITLRYTLSAGAPESKATAAAGKLVSLAKRIEATRRRAFAPDASGATAGFGTATKPG